MSRRVLTTLATLATVATAAVLPAAVLTAAPAAAADSWSVPASASITIRGHGYGHGHGMSQYGAQGAALQGLTHRRILGFYYPRTKVGRIGGQVTVLISGDTSDDLVVAARSGLTLKDSGTGTKVTLPDNGATLWRVEPTAGGVNRVSYFKQRWRTWADLEGWGEFAAGAKPVTLVTPAGRMAYRGRLRAVPDPTDASARVTVNVTSLENYVKGVVPREVPALWHPQAVQAQSVAARTYAAHGRAHPLTSRYQICDTTACQVYGGATAEHPAANRAVNATQGEIRTFKGEPAYTQFSSSSGGWTAGNDVVPYLPAQRDPYDGWSGNPNHTWTTKITDSKVEKAFPQLGNLRRIVVKRRDGHGQWGGRIVSIRLVGSDASTTVRGDDFRFALGLRSEWVTFEVRKR